MSQPTKLILEEGEFKHIYIPTLPTRNTTTHPFGITHSEIAELLGGIGHVEWVDFAPNHDRSGRMAIVRFAYWFDTGPVRNCRSEIKTKGSCLCVDSHSGESFSLRADYRPTSDEYAGAMRILSIEVENHEYLTGVEGADKKADFTEKLGIVCEAARGLSDIGVLQRRVAELERQAVEREKLMERQAAENKKLLDSAARENRKMLQDLEMQVWRVSQGLPRYDTWTPPRANPNPPRVNPNDQPRINPVPDPSKY